MRLLSYATKRLLLILVFVFVVILFLFGFTLFILGDPVVLIFGDFVMPEQVAKINVQLETDQLFLVRYWHYVEWFAHGNLGTLYFMGQSVGHSIAQLLFNMLQLVIFSAVVAIVLGFVLGGVLAYFYLWGLDRSVSVAIIVLQAVFNFVLVLVLIYVVFFLLGWALLFVGVLSLTDLVFVLWIYLTLLDAVLDGCWDSVVFDLMHSILLSLSFGVVLVAVLAKIVRTTMAREFVLFQVEFGRACGLFEWRVFRYVYFGSRILILTSIVMLLGTFMGGTAIMEMIFVWSGVGCWALEGMGRVDVPVIQGFIFVMGFGMLLIYLVLDIIVVFMDSRIFYR